MLDLLSKKTKADLIEEIEQLYEERNRLCARISELSEPQFQEVKEKAQQAKLSKEAENEKEALERKNTQLEISMLRMASLANIGKNYEDELDEQDKDSIFAAIGAISIATFYVLDRKDNDD